MQLRNVVRPYGAKDSKFIIRHQIHRKRNTRRRLSRCASIQIDESRQDCKLFGCVYRLRWPHQKFLFEMAVAQGVWRTEPRRPGNGKSKGKSPVGDVGEEAPQKLKQFSDIVYIFCYSETIKF